MAIKDWADTDKPREKMMAQGKAVLSNAELLAILIGSGTTHESAVALSQRILSSVSNSLTALGKQTLDIQLLDHVIITEKQYTSLCDEGLC
jgi:DNA repair protein radC